MGIRALILLAVPLACAGAELRMRLFWNTRVDTLQAGNTTYRRAELGARTVSLAAGTQIRSGRTSLILTGPAVLRAGKDSLQLTVRMPLEEYVAEALTGEMGGAQEPEALKAMAVAARSYARAAGARHAAEGFDVCDTTHCQDARWPVPERIRSAVDATVGEIVWYNGAVARTHYHADCGGSTEAASSVWPFSGRPYLARRDDAEFHTEWLTDWRAALTRQQLAQVLGLPRVTTLEVGARTESGRVSTVLADGRPMSAESMHIAAGRVLGWGVLRSQYYEISEIGDRVVFTGRGAGHGVGLCQRGAMARAKAGQDYRTILAAYYPGTKTGVTPEGIVWSRRSTERVEVWTSGPSDVLAPLLDRTLADAEKRAGWQLTGRPQVRVFPTVAAYRDATGEPGFVAASARGGIIRMQPEGVLRAAGRLEATLRHEFLHLLLGAKARQPLPAWFEEGLVMCLEEPGGPLTRWTNEDLLLLQKARSESELRRGYQAARARVAALLRSNGWETVLSWLGRGLPAQ
jgi:stage II sporulation protein D